MAGRTKWDSCHLVLAEKEQKSSCDWSSDSLMESIFWVQSITGLTSFSQGSPRIMFLFPRFITYIEGGSADYSSDVEEQGSGEPDSSFGVDRVVHVSGLDRGFQALGRDSLFPDKPPVDARDACSTVDKGSGVNGFHRVRGNDKLNWDLHSG